MRLRYWWDSLPIQSVMFRPFQHTKAARRTHFASYILLCKGESGGDGLMALPLPSIPEAETLPCSPLPVRTTGTGGVFTSMGENFPWLVLGGQTWLERGAQSRTKGSTETDRELCLTGRPALTSCRSARFPPGDGAGSRPTVPCFAVRAGEPSSGSLYVYPIRARDRPG